MTNKNAAKLKVLSEIQKIFNVGDKDIEKIPEAITRLAQAASVSPCLVAFVFDPMTGQLKQVATSQLPQTPEVYGLVARVITGLAQQFQNIAVEVAKNVARPKETRVGEDVPTSNNNKSRDGPSSEGHGVDAEVSVVDSGNNGINPSRDVGPT